MRSRPLTATERQALRGFPERYALVGAPRLPGNKPWQTVRNVRVTDPAEAMQEQCSRGSRLVTEHAREVTQAERCLETMAYAEHRERAKVARREAREATRQTEKRERARQRQVDAAIRRIQVADARATERRTAGSMAWLASE
jgi:hypothetical protein